MRIADMPLSIRLDETTERKLAEVCKQLGCTKSEAVKASLNAWLERFEPVPDAYALGEDLFDTGQLASAPEDPLKRQLWERLHAKHSNR